jgi:hypothetical protein
MWSYQTTRSFISPLPSYVENKAGNETLTVAAMCVCNPAWEIHPVMKLE